MENLQLCVFNVNVCHVSCNSLPLSFFFFAYFFVWTVTFLVADDFTSFRKFSVLCHWYSVPFHYINEEVLFNNSHSVKCYTAAACFDAQYKGTSLFFMYFFSKCFFCTLPSETFLYKVRDLTCSSSFFTCTVTGMSYLLLLV